MVPGPMKKCLALVTMGTERWEIEVSGRNRSEYEAALAAQDAAAREHGWHRAAIGPPRMGVAFMAYPVLYERPTANLDRLLRWIAGGFVLLSLFLIVGLASQLRSGPNGAVTLDTPRNITGVFVRWVPVDDGHGYAYISITNNGASSATAKCTVEVRDDFGDFGYDFMVGQPVAAGQTWSGRMALTVGKGSFLINSGDVKDC